MDQPPVSIRKTVRGKRPAFHEQESIDRLVAMVLTLASELSVVRERLDTLEVMGSEAGWLDRERLESFRPSPAQKAERERRREEFLGRLFQVLREEIEDLEGGETEQAYWAAVQETERE